MPPTSNIRGLFTKSSDQRERVLVGGAAAAIGWRPCRPVLRRTLPTVLALVLVLGASSAATVSGGQRLAALARGQRPHSPERLGNPTGFSAGPPAPYRYQQYSTHYPWYGYGFGVPTYNWGYFGVRWRPGCISHTGYYDDYMQWSYRRGY